MLQTGCESITTLISSVPINKISDIVHYNGEKSKKTAGYKLLHEIIVYFISLYQVAEADCFKLFANVINELSSLETNHRCHMICNTLAILWLCWQNIMTIVNRHWSHTGAFNYTVTYTT